MRAPALLVSNSTHPAAIGDAIAALPAVWRLAKEGLISRVVWSCPLMPGVFDLGIPQHSWEDPGLAAYPGNPRHLEVQAIVSAGLRAGPDSLPRYFWRAAGLPADEPLVWPVCSTYPPVPAGVDADWVLVAPHSHSDHGTGTKVWPAHKWGAVVDAIKDYSPMATLAGPTDKGFDFNWDLTLVGLSIPELIAAMTIASVVITVDNGMGWLAQAIGASHIQILSSNMPEAYSFDPGPHATNLPHNASAPDLVNAVKGYLFR